MPTLATKPTLAITAFAALVMGASGVSAAARAASSTSPTTPSALVGRPGPGGGMASTALANQLGVSVADLQAAIRAVRESDDTSTATDDRTTEAKTIADALGVSQATIQTIFDDQKPTAHDGRPSGPPAGAPTATTPTATTPPSGTTPPAGHGGGHGPGALSSEDATVIAAIVKATGKDQATVKAAIAKADAVRDAARKARDAEFAKKLAQQLHLGEDKVLNAIETTTPAPPARAARQASGQTS